MWPISSSLAGDAWQTQAAVFEHDPVRRHVELRGLNDTALRRLVWRDLAWSFRIPIINSKNETALVVLLDGSAPLKDTQEVTKAFEAFADVVGEAFKPVVAKFEDDAADG